MYVDPPALIVEKHARYGQLYIYDDAESLKFRTQDKALNPDYVSLIQDYIMRHNVYAQQYKSLGGYLRGEESEFSEEVSLKFFQPSHVDRRRYNAPILGEIAVVIPSRDGVIDREISFEVRKRDDNRLVYIKCDCRDADPLLFPLMFPSGDVGWTYHLRSRNEKNLSARQYYGYRLAYRDDIQSNYILRFGRLTQQYITNAYVVVETERLKFLKLHQSKLRAETYQGLRDHIAGGVNTSDSVRLGHSIILPATYLGSPRQLQNLYHDDAMAICRKIGPPSLFITVTCNPKWGFVKEYRNRLGLDKKQSAAADVSMIICRGFGSI